MPSPPFEGWENTAFYYFQEWGIWNRIWWTFSTISDPELFFYNHPCQLIRTYHDQWGKIFSKYCLLRLNLRICILSLPIHFLTFFIFFKSLQSFWTFKKMILLLKGISFAEFDLLVFCPYSERTRHKNNLLLPYSPGPTVLYCCCSVMGKGRVSNNYLWPVLLRELIEIKFWCADIIFFLIFKLQVG